MVGCSLVLPSMVFGFSFDVRRMHLGFFPGYLILVGLSLGVRWVFSGLSLDRWSVSEFRWILIEFSFGFV